MVTIRRVAPEEVTDYIDGLSDILIDCVEGGASVGFMLPISRSTATGLWQHVGTGVQRGERILLVALRTKPASNSFGSRTERCRPRPIPLCRRPPNARLRAYAAYPSDAFSFSFFR